MFFFNEKLKRRVDEIGRYIVKETLPITEFMVRPGNDLDGYEAEIDSSWHKAKDSDQWGGFAQYQWFRTEITVPESWEGSHVDLYVNTPGDIAWKVSAEYSTYIDGRLVGGMDIFHHYIRIADKAKAGERHALALLGFSGYNVRRPVIECSLVVIDDDVKRYYYDLKNAFEAVEFSSTPDAPEIIEMRDHVNASVNLVDFRIPGSDAFRASVVKADEELRKTVYDKMRSSSAVTVTAIGHSHLDVAWLWRLMQTKEKGARAFATVDRLMGEYPDFRFIQSQPQVYDYTKKNYPELYERVKKRVAEGRLEPEGGMWVEADCNLISGESMIRQFLVGKRFFHDEFGVDNEILWLPDVFGYSAAMPQILNGCGIRYFMTTKISWNQFNRLPMDTFYLQGIDGSKVLTHFMTTPIAAGPGARNSLPYKKTYNGEICAETVIHSWDTYKEKDINNDLLFAFGYGDGGGGPDQTMLENAERLKDLPGVPHLKQGFAGPYFHELEKRIKGKKVPTWVGELYLEFHRGTYTSIARNKRYNRKTEFLYHDVEALSSICELATGHAYPQERINEDWKVILLNQFHDIIPGSAIGPVYEDSWKQYEALEKSGGAMKAEAVSALVAGMNLSGDSVVVFNPNSAFTSSLVIGDYPELKGALRNGSKVYPVQTLSDGRKAFYVSDVPQYGYAAFSVVDKECPKKRGMKVSTTLLENRYFRIKLGKDGTITSFVDKRIGRNIITQGRRANVIESYEDKPMEYNCWDIDIYYKEKKWEVDDVESIAVTEDGPVMGAVKIVRRYLNSTIEQTIRIYADIPRVDFDTEIDWHEQEILLKAAFPVDVNSSRASYEIQFGSVERNTHFNTSWDVAKFETCAHKWADLSETGYGVSLMNDCKYGYDIHNGEMRITLLKSGIYPNENADKGHHRFVYSFYPHEGGWAEGRTVNAAYALNNPMEAVYSTGHDGSLPASASFVGIDNSSIIIDTLKKAENGDGYIVRLYESSNSHSDGTIRFSSAPSYVALCDMLEGNEKQVACDGNDLKVSLRPYEIRTYKVRF